MGPRGRLNSSLAMWREAPGAHEPGHATVLHPRPSFRHEHNASRRARPRADSKAPAPLQSALSGTRGVADDMPVRQRRQVCVGGREAARPWLLHAYWGSRWSWWPLCSAGGGVIAGCATVVSAVPHPVTGALTSQPRARNAVRAADPDRRSATLKVDAGKTIDSAGARRADPRSRCPRRVPIAPRGVPAPARSLQRAAA